jgi:hypothetical protein
VGYLSFTVHPASVGETYLAHLRRAVGFGISTMNAGLAFFVNGLCPFLFTHSAPSIVASPHDRIIVNGQRIEDHDGRASPVHGRQTRPKATAWWIEFANGRHSSPYPSEDEARAVITSARLFDAVSEESAPRWLVSSEGLRMAIPNSSASASLPPIGLGLAAILALLVGGAIYSFKHTIPAQPAASVPLLTGRTITTHPSHGFTTVASPPPKARSGGRNSGLDRLVTRILNAHDRDQKLCAGAGKSASLALSRRD